MITTYRAELFQALHTATTSLGWEVIPTPNDELKVFVNADDCLFDTRVYTMPMELHSDLEEGIFAIKLDKLKGELDYQMDLKKVAERNDTIRKQALFKLTEEEKKALGL